MKSQNRQEDINKSRRKFLTVILLGSGAFLTEKILGPLSFRFFNDSPTEDNFENFKIVKNKNGLSVHDNSGEEIFQIDNET